MDAVKLLCIDDEKTTYLKNWSLLNSNYGKPYLESNSLKQTKNKHPIFRLENKTKHFDLGKKDIHLKPCHISNPQLQTQKRGRQQKIVSRKGFYKPSKTKIFHKQTTLSLSPSQQKINEQRDFSTLNLYNLSNLQKKSDDIKEYDTSQVRDCLFSNVKIANSMEKNYFRVRSNFALEIDRDYSKSQFRSKPMKQPPLYLRTEVLDRIDKCNFSKINNNISKKRRILRYRPIKFEEQPSKNLIII